MKEGKERERGRGRWGGRVLVEEGLGQRNQLEQGPSQLGSFPPKVITSQAPGGRSCPLPGSLTAGTAL